MCQSYSQYQFCTCVLIILFYLYKVNYIQSYYIILGVFRGEIGVLGYANMNRCYVCGQTVQSNRCYVCGQAVPSNLVIGAPSTPLCPTTQVVSQYSSVFFFIEI